MKERTRRELIQGGAASAAALLASNVPKATAEIGSRREAAIIGHTGAGNFGHGIDRIFNGLPAIAVAAVADPNPAGRAKAKKSSGAARDYADYREMLTKETPQLVGVGPRWSGEHHAMTMAALEVGAHVYLEKPFTLTLAEADEILRLAAKKERKIAVAHVTRCAPIVLRLEKALKEGLIGEVLEIHTVGKMGSRAGRTGHDGAGASRVRPGATVRGRGAVVPRTGQAGRQTCKAQRCGGVAVGPRGPGRRRRHLRALRDGLWSERDLPQPPGAGKSRRAPLGWRSSAPVAWSA